MLSIMKDYYVVPGKPVDLNWIADLIRARLSRAQAELFKNAIALFNSYEDELSAENPLELYLTGSMARDVTLHHAHGSAYAKTNVAPVLLDFQLVRQRPQEHLDAQDQSFFTHFCQQLSSDEDVTIKQDKHHQKWMNYYHSTGAYFVRACDGPAASLLSSVHMKINLRTGEILFRSKELHQQFEFARIEIYNLSEMLEEIFNKKLPSDIQDYQPIFHEREQLLKRIGHVLYVAYAMRGTGFKYSKATHQAIYTDKEKTKQTLAIRNDLLAKKTAEHDAFEMPEDEDRDSQEEKIKQINKNVRDKQKRKVLMRQFKSEAIKSIKKKEKQKQKQKQKQEQRKETTVALVPAPGNDLMVVQTHHAQMALARIINNAFNAAHVAAKPIAQGVAQSVVDAKEPLIFLVALSFVLNVARAEGDLSIRVLKFILSIFILMLTFYYMDRATGKAAINLLKEAAQNIKNNPHWDLKLCRQVFISLQLNPSLKLDSDNHPKIIFLAKLLSIYKKLDKNIDDHGMGLINALMVCYGSLETAANAQYLFLADEFPISDDLKSKEKGRRMVNNYFVMHKRASFPEERAYISKLERSLPYLNIYRFYVTAFKHDKVPEVNALADSKALKK
jgi:hypothetical protein